MRRVTYEDGVAYRFAVHASKKNEPEGPEAVFGTVERILQMDPFVMSDTHFFHEKVYQQYCPSRQTFAESHKTFDSKLLGVLRQCSAILHLGDLCIDSRGSIEKTEKRVKTVSRALCGIPKILVKGNHDSLPDSFYEENGWAVVSSIVDVARRRTITGPPAIVFEAKHGPVIATHFPAYVGKDEAFDDRYRSERAHLSSVRQEIDAWVNLHGHTHEHSVPDPTTLNMSVEAIGFSPKRLSEIVGPYIHHSLLTKHESNPTVSIRSQSSR